MHLNRSVVLVLLLSGLLSASFDVSQYILPSENGTAVSYENFTVNGISYSLVSIGSEKTFLLKEGVPLGNKNDISSVIYTYYKTKYYPSSAELASVRTMLTQFNHSRNDGYSSSFAGKEELYCRQALFIDGRLEFHGKYVQCVDNESCQTAAVFVFHAYRDAFGFPSITNVLSDLKNFSYASNALEKSMDSNFNYIDNINESNAYTNLVSIKNSIPGMKASVYNIEHTIFRTPRPDDNADIYACSKCYGLCLPFSFNQSVLTALESNLTALTSRLSNFANYKTLSASVAGNTAYRFSYLSNETNATYYSAVFAPLGAKGYNVIIFASAVEVHITNSSFSADLTKLKNLHSKINLSIKSRNFATIESDLSEYQAIIPVVNDTARNISKIYNNTLDLKKKVDGLILLLDSKDLDSGSRNELDYLKNKTLYLSLMFRDGLLDEEVLSYQNNYSELYNQSKILLNRYNSHPVSVLSVGFRGFARGVNTGIADVLSSSKVISVSEVPKQSTLAFGVVSVLMFLSLAALFFLIFLVLVDRITHKPARYGLAGLFLLSLFVLSLFSAGLYLFLGKTSTDAEIEEFIFDVNKRNSTAVAVFAANATDPTYMLSCSDSLASLFHEKNKTTRRYTFYSGYCTIENATVLWDEKLNQSVTAKNISNSTVAECGAQLKNETSTIEFDYSSTTNPPKFSIIYINKATISADSAYYKSCPLAGLFS